MSVCLPTVSAALDGGGTFEHDIPVVLTHTHTWFPASVCLCAAECSVALSAYVNVSCLKTNSRSPAADHSTWEALPEYLALISSALFGDEAVFLGLGCLKCLLPTISLSLIGLLPQIPDGVMSAERMCLCVCMCPSQDVLPSTLNSLTCVCVVCVCVCVCWMDVIPPILNSQT